MEEKLEERLTAHYKLAMQSGKLHSKVSNDRCAHSGHTCELVKRLDPIADKKHVI